MFQALFVNIFENIQIEDVFDPNHDEIHHYYNLLSDRLVSVEQILESVNDFELVDYHKQKLDIFIEHLLFESDFEQISDKYFDQMDKTLHDCVVIDVLLLSTLTY